MGHTSEDAHASRSNHEGRRIHTCGHRYDRDYDDDGNDDEYKYCDVNCWHEKTEDERDHEGQYGHDNPTSADDHDFG